MSRPDSDPLTLEMKGIKTDFSLTHFQVWPLGAGTWNHFFKMFFSSLNNESCTVHSPRGAGSVVTKRLPVVSIFTRVVSVDSQLETRGGILDQHHKLLIHECSGRLDRQLHTTLPSVHPEATPNIKHRQVAIFLSELRGHSTVSKSAVLESMSLRHNSVTTTGKKNAENLLISL